MDNSGASPILPVNLQALHNIQKEARQALAKAVESEGSLQDMVELSLFNPMVQAQKFRDLEKFKTQQQKEAQENPEEVKIMGVESADEVATRFQNRNPELKDQTLLILRSMLKETDTPEEIIQKVLSVYPDPALADEALEFLFESSRPPFSDTIKKARERLNQDYERSIKAGRNIGAEARAFAQEGLGSPTSLRDMYRDITGNRREPLKLFDELVSKFAYNKLKSVIAFLLHSLGSDLKAKGPSIDVRELARLIEETRSLQGLLGIFRFFQSRGRLIVRLFKEEHLQIPQQLGFELISKLLVKILAEKYISPDKIRKTAEMLGIDKAIIAQAIIYAQMYDSLRQIAPQYYRSNQHRQEIIKAFTEMLEAIEEEKEEQEEENQRQKKKKKEKDS